MANTYIQIGSTITAGAGGTSSVSFTSIPQTYTDLVIKFSSRNSDSSVRIRFNSATTGYSETLIYGSGTTAASTNTSAQTSLVWGVSNNTSTLANTFSSGEIYIPNYTAAINKFILMDSVTEANTAAADQYMDAGLWSNTAAITQIDLFGTGSPHFIQYSSFSLYGILKS